MADGSYVMMRERLTQQHLLAHLRGEMTLGTYVLDTESQSHFLVLDADDTPDWRRLKALAGVLAEEGTTSYLEASRRGGHMWLFFDSGYLGEEIRDFGRGMLDHFGIEDIELFPKQDKLSSGPGSLMRLPFGVHRKSGKRYGFYLADGTPLAPTLREQIHALRAPESVSKAHWERFSAHWATMQAEGVPERPPTLKKMKLEGERYLSEQIKEAISVRQFVLSYVELAPSGKGLCPFHDDQVPSLHVNDEKDFWYCFGCEKGGSVIDFYMELEGCDFKTAIDELAVMLFDLPGEESTLEES
jgi:hypothetical protein